MMVKFKDGTYINSRHVVLMERIDSQRLKIVLIDGQVFLARDNNADRIEQEICSAERKLVWQPTGS